MLLLFYAITHCLAAYVLHLVCMILGTAILTLFNIFTPVLLGFFIVCSGAEFKPLVLHM